MTDTNPSPGVRLVILGGPAARRVERLAVRSELRVGRTEPGAAPPDIALDADPRVSRRHAIVRLGRSGWMIEDTASKRGTRVGGRAIAGLGPVPLEPGAIVETGETRWVLVPESWLFVEIDGLVAWAPCADALNYAACHCGVPPVGPVAAHNRGPGRAGPASLVLQIAGFTDPCAIEFPALAPGEAVTLPPPHLRVNTEALRRLSELVEAELLLWPAAGGRPLVRRPVAVLGLWDWSTEPAARRTVAAFVTPRDPAVERLVGEARQTLRAVAGVDAWGEVLRAVRDDAERVILETLYRHMAEHVRVEYERPDLAPLAGSVPQRQIIRGSHRLLAGAGTARGTCLDLAVLMAACLERLSLCPVLVFTDDAELRPRHAMAGCWVGPVPGGSPLIDSRAAILRRIADGELLLVECTGFAEGAGPRLAFTEAIERARALVDAAPAAWAVDVAASRPPYGSVTPMAFTREPEVSRAEDQAEAIAAAAGAPALETSHIFAGLLAARGGVTTWLVREAGVNPEEAIRRARERLDALPAGGRRPGGELRPTARVIALRRMAEDLAWQAGASLVREIDLLWVLLLRGGESRRLAAMAEAIGLGLERLVALLSQRYPCPRVPTTVTSLPPSGPNE